MEAHERSCHYAPVFCPVDWRCDFPGGPTDALERHVTAVHGWTVVGVRYGEPVRVRARPGPSRSLLRARTSYVKSAAGGAGMQHRIQMQSKVWGTSLRDGVLYTNPVSVKVPGSMLPMEGPEQDSVEVRIVKVSPAGAGDSVNSN
ncbi:uncharacterized protein [Miscanthus floridulus]|uniref:uncharacterized protein n=1 Tax=Miscanthus floridulus TaxID=154761 RepID=UPI003459E8D6